MDGQRSGRRAPVVSTPALALPRELRDFLTAGVKELCGPKAPTTEAKVKEIVKESRPAPPATPSRSPQPVPAPLPKVPRELQDYLDAGANELLSSRKRAIKPSSRFGVDEDEPGQRPATKSAQLAARPPRRAEAGKKTAAVKEALAPVRAVAPVSDARLAVPCAAPPPAASAAASGATPSPPVEAAEAPALAPPPMVMLGIPLPEHWPTPLLPSAFLQPGAQLRPASPAAIARASSSHEPFEAGSKLLSGAEQRPKTGVRARRCVCGKVDKSKWTIACAGCDRVVHGSCVGADESLRQACPKRKRGQPAEWVCRGCLTRRKRQRREQDEFGWADRATLYCVCLRPWDGKEFMIACDSCQAWYHGACVGLAVPTVEAGTQAAFRRYACPRCAPPASSQQACAAAPAVLAPPWAGLGPKALGKRHAGAQPPPLISCSTSTSGESSASASPPPYGIEPVHAPLDGIEFGLDASADAGPSALAWLAAAAAAMLPQSAADMPISLFNSAPNSALISAPNAAPTSAPAGAPVRPFSPLGPRVGLLDCLTDDCVTAILAKLPLASLLLCAVPLSRRGADLAEPLFRAECDARGWRLQRRMANTLCAWRRMLRARSCAVCLAASAPFAVRRPPATAAAFRLCRACARRTDVQEQCHWHGLDVESIGEHGQPLFSRQFHTPLFGCADGFTQRAIRRG
jgi:hypothetical protein